MKIEDCIARIEKYLQAEDHSPRFVHVLNTTDLALIAGHFKVGNIAFISVDTLAQEDENPTIEKLQNFLSNEEGDCFLTGWTTFLKLQGEQALIKELRNLAARSFKGHVVVLCYQCTWALQFKDLRLKRLVIEVDGNPSKLPEIVFTLPSMPTVDSIITVKGIQNLPAVIETREGGRVYVKTKKTRNSYPNSLFYIEQENTAYEVLCSLDSTTKRLDVHYGTEEQWRSALDDVRQYGSWGEVVDQNFGSGKQLGLNLGNWQFFDKERQWLYFIALKLYGAGSEWCLNAAIRDADTVDYLIRAAYRSLLSVDHSDPNFWIRYDERKKAILSLGISESEIIDYCLMVHSKDQYALYYLTDFSEKEKNLTYELLDKYADQYPREEILEILRHTYPDLYAYLQPYRFSNDTLTWYFQEYKYQKVLNTIYPDFLTFVDEQAKLREFNLWLPKRVSELEGLNKDGAKLYFVDAMGVEYLSFILNKCKELNLMADIKICRCELPSITEMNKEFLEYFDDIAPDVKELDEIKHHGVESLDYQHTKLPTHLDQELQIIYKVLKNIHALLGAGTIERAYIIADHGASRLAVTRESECQWEMASKGEHSGRCCPVNEADVQSEYATEENGFWVLANYDRFKGGRKASVEVHGGASLEEVTVPIIEFTYLTGPLEVSIDSALPIPVSFRKKAEIVLFSKTKLGGVSVCVNGPKITDQYYDAEPLDNNKYRIVMPEVKNRGTYSMTVFSNGNEITRLKFAVEKEGAKINSIL